MGLEYSSPMGITQQFRHCGNPFRIDGYRGCDFGCKYCFATTKNFITYDGTDFREADIDKLKRKFSKALDGNTPSKNLEIECLRQRVPLHLGGMSDPFQSREWDYRITYEILKLSKKYNYPIMISTKTDYLPDEYWEILDPDIHAFQISLIGVTESYIRKFETNTPSPINRINFIKQIKSKGFWCGVRLQPLISIDEAEALVKQISGIVDFITVEHLKISTDDKKFRNLLFAEYNNDLSMWKCTGKNYELKSEIKLNNINRLKAVSKCPIGCGDNDMHLYSDTLNCCGIDTINSNFNQWIKYNSMYIEKTTDDTQWYPSSNCSKCFNSECVKKGFSFKDYVDYYLEHPKPDKQVRIKL